MKKVLLVATVQSHICQFHKPLVEVLHENGVEVHVAARDNLAEKNGLKLDFAEKVFDVPFHRSPYSLKNIKAFKMLKKIINEGEYDIIHCNTPVGGILTRMAAKKARKCGTKVFYTAHGFHFYKGAPKKNWLLWYSIEKYFAKYTDVLITMNNEDYNVALNNFRAKKIVKTDGVGVDLSIFNPLSDDERKILRDDYGFDKSGFILIYTADLCKRKNQTMIFKAIAFLKDRIPELLVLMPGQQTEIKKYKKICKQLNITKQIDMCGYRRDIYNLLNLSDCALSSSMQEGLPVNLMEAAACGRYIVATDVRGNSDVVSQVKFGQLVKLNDYKAMADAIYDFYINRYVVTDSIKSVKVFEKENIKQELRTIYGFNE